MDEVVVEFLQDEEIQGRPEDWQDKLAMFISVLLSPFIIIPIFIYLIVAAYSRSSTEFAKLGIIAFIFSTIIPFLNVYIAVKRGNISDIHVAIREERKKPFLVALASLLLCTVVLHFMGAPREIVILGLVMFINGILFFIITMYWKISMHLSVLACVLVSICYLVDRSFLIYGLILIPILIWARMRRQRHSFYQGITGTLIAGALTYYLLSAFSISPRV